MNNIDITVLHEYLRYEPDTGKFYWVKGLSNVKAGEEAGAHHSDGYIIIGLKGKRLRAHRVAWAMTHGEWPVMLIDHKNDIRDDNRIDNLQQATNQQNQQRRLRVRAWKKEPKGVCYRAANNHYVAAIVINKRKVRLGAFPTAQQAHEAYCEAAKHHFGEFYNAGERAAIAAQTGDAALSKKGPQA